MGRWIILLFAVAAITTGCLGRSSRDTTLYQSSGRAKPIVAVMPVIDQTQQKMVNWDISKEITEEIRERVFTSPRLYLLREVGSLEVANQLSVPNPQNLSKSLSNSFGAAEFVVVTEIIDEKLTSHGFSKDNEKPYLEEVSANLELAVRLRVIDVRGDQPKVILQEVIDHDHIVGRPYLNCDYEKNRWGTEAYKRTPLGIIHNKIAREIVSRVEGYVGAARG